MSKQIDINAYLAKIKKFKIIFFRHSGFVAILIILFIYLFTVWRISTLATAEPTNSAENAALATTNIPRVDKNAVNQIQSLEKSNVQIQSLFNSARNNPFQE